MTVRRLLALWILLLSAACGVPVDSQPRGLDAGAAPFRSLAPDATPAPGGVARALIYLTRDGVLVAVTRRVTRPAPGPLLQVLLAGPADREREAGLDSAVPRGLTIEPTSPNRGVVSVTLPASDTSSGSRTDEVLGLGQLVLTMTSLPGVQGVQFVRDGHALSVPRGDGSLTTGILTRSDYTALL